MNIEQLIGNTPMLELLHYDAVIYAKLEKNNPSGSIKDRIAKAMLDDAREQGLINKDSTIIEPTSGNTGIGLAMLCAIYGYKLILTMPSSMSVERRKLLQVYGARLVLVDGNMGDAVKKAAELLEEIPNSCSMRQFDNPANPAIHRATTGPEIWRDTNGEFDVFVAGVGTGGTISGVGQFLKQQNPHIKIVAVEPSRSPFLTQGIAGKHGIMGIGAGFLPKTLDKTVIDEYITIDDEQAIETADLLAKTHGLHVGISSGANFAAAMMLSATYKRIVTVLPDGGERYMSELQNA